MVLSFLTYKFKIPKYIFLNQIKCIININSKNQIIFRKVKVRSYNEATFSDKGLQGNKVSLQM